jgi:hypothetical protein
MAATTPRVRRALAPATFDAALTAERNARLAAFYAAQHQLLRLRVRRHVCGADDGVIEDACAYAWLQIVRRDDVALDRRGFGWLVRVAVHEAWRFQRPGEQRAYGGLDEAGPPEPDGTAGDPLERALAAECHRERIARFATLKPDERRDLLLHAAGYRYHEIAQLSGVIRCRRRVPRGAVR